MDGESAVELSIELPIESNGYYTIKQTNPGLEYYKDDNTVSNASGSWVKTKTYNLTAGGDNNYQFLATDKPGDIVIEVAQGSSPVAKYTIKNNLTFTA